MGGQIKQANNITCVNQPRNTPFRFIALAIGSWPHGGDMTLDGRSPGLRFIIANPAFPIFIEQISGMQGQAILRLQLRGQPRVWQKKPHRVPYYPTLYDHG